MDTRHTRIIVVDDDLTSLTAIKNILKPLYEVYIASSAAKMFELLMRITPGLILLDVDMPELNGYETAQFLKSDRDHRDIPIIFMTSKDDINSEMAGLELGVVDYIYKPYAAPLLLKQVETHLLLTEQRKELQEHNASIQKKLLFKIAEIFELQNAIINIVADLVECRDGTTGGHISRTEKYLQRFIDKLMDENIYGEEIMSWEMDFLLPSAQLHDIGKIAISDTILNKPAKLTDDEYAIMKTHTQIGLDAISRMESQTTDSKFFKYAKIFAYAHHEKWDGSGYPKGLKETNIPLEGRLMAIVDVYDALVSARPYKERFSPKIAAEIIINGSGKHFDPQLVDVFKMVSNEFAEISKIEQAEQVLYPRG